MSDEMKERNKCAVFSIIAFFACLTFTIVVIQLVGLAVDTVATHYHLGRCA